MSHGSVLEAKKTKGVKVIVQFSSQAWQTKRGFVKNVRISCANLALKYMLKTISLLSRCIIWLRQCIQNERAKKSFDAILLI